MNLIHRLYWSGYAALQMLAQYRASYRSPAALRRIRDRNVRRMVRYAYRHVPYYRETLDTLGLTPADFRTFDDLEKLPLIDPADLQTDPSRFWSDAIPDERTILLWSEGTTNQPKAVRQSNPTLLQNADHARRQLVPIERALGTRSYKRLHIDIVGATGQTVRSRLRSNAWVPRFLRVEHSYADMAGFPESVLEALERERPEILSMYGNSWVGLLAHVERTGARFHKPRLANSGGERLPPGGAERIDLIWWQGQQ